MKDKKKTKKIIVAVVLVLIGVLVSYILLKDKIGGKLVKGEIGVTDTILKYGEEGYFILYTDGVKYKYDAFDITMEFDNDVIEILGYDNGDLKTDSGETVELAGTSVDKANKDGRLTIVYVDPTAGDRELSFEKADIVYVRFRAKKPNKNVSINIEDLHLVDSECVETGKNSVNIRNGGVTIE